MEKGDENVHIWYKAVRPTCVVKHVSCVEMFATRIKIESRLFLRADQGIKVVPHNQTPTPVLAIVWLRETTCTTKVASEVQKSTDQECMTAFDL